MSPILSRVEEERLARADGWKPYEERVIELLTEIRDNQRTQAPAQAPAAGFDVIRSVAEELNAAAAALEASAKQLKEDGKGWRAGHAHQAALRAKRAAEELLGA